MSVSSDRLLEKLEGKRQMGKAQWVARCPAHADKEPSLSITAIDGQTLLYCHAGCDTRDVVQSLNLSMADLFDDPKGKSYEYRDGVGRLMRTVHRSPDKQFRQTVVDNSLVPLYRLYEVTEAVASGRDVWITEGEKDADAMRAIYGVTATTSPMGAANWSKADWSSLQNAGDVYVVADDDPAGRTRAIALAEYLGPAVEQVRIMLPRIGKDVADHIAAGYGLEDLAPYTVIAPEPEDRSVTEQPYEPRLTTKLLREILEDEELDGYDWLIPDILERRERLILTGGEGIGKMVLIRQMTLLSAAGLHPFKGTRIEPVKVLVFDSENSERQWKRQAKYVANRAADLGARDPALHYRLALQQQLNITNRRDLDDIHYWIDEFEPDVVVTAPLYKLVPHSITTDDEASPVLAALDTIRDRGITLIMEAHAGHDATKKVGSPDAAWAPRGSSALKGWPEHGLGLAPVEFDNSMVAVKKWRGSREERDWPWLASWQAAGSAG